MMNLLTVFLGCATCFQITFGFLLPPKPGKCPKPVIGICISNCHLDSDCTGRQKCCRNGCGGRTCQNPCPMLPCHKRYRDCSKHGGPYYSQRGCKGCGCVCPPSKPIVYCKVNPCQVNKCAKYPDAICKPNYCGGCNADFYLNGEKVDCKNPSSYDAMPRRECPPGKPLVYCWRNPCQGQTCESHPNARCVPNFCGGCFFSFYVGWRRVNC